MPWCPASARKVLSECRGCVRVRCRLSVVSLASDVVGSFHLVVM